MPRQTAACMPAWAGLDGWVGALVAAVRCMARPSPRVALSSSAAQRNAWLAWPPRVSCPHSKCVACESPLAQTQRSGAEYCLRGSLYDLLKTARQNGGLAKALDWPKRITMALDAAKVGGGLVLVWCSGKEASVCLILRASGWGLLEVAARVSLNGAGRSTVWSHQHTSVALGGPAAAAACGAC